MLNIAVGVQLIAHGLFHVIILHFSGHMEGLGIIIPVGGERLAMDISRGRIR